MRKNVIALMLVLPLLFMVVFSQMMNVPLGATPTVTSVRLRNKPDGGTRTVELLDYGDDYEFSVDVLPQAAEQGVKVSYEHPDGTPYTEEEELPVEAVPVEGKKNAFTVKADTVGNTVIRVTSVEGGLSDSFSFNVVSSRAYDYSFSLAKSGGEGSENLVEETGKDLFTGTVAPGTYTYAAEMIPANTSFAIPRISSVSGDAVVDEGKSEIRFNFAGGKVSFDVFVPDLPEENATKHVELSVDFAAGEIPEGRPILVNGSAVAEDEDVVPFRLGSLSDEAADLSATTTVYLQTRYAGEITVTPSNATLSVAEMQTEVSETGNYRNYKLLLAFSDTGREDLSLTVAYPADEAGNVERIRLGFSFEAFSFKLRASIGGKDKIFDSRDEIPSQALLLDTSISFSAVPDFEAEGILYKWELHTENGATMKEEDYESVGGLPLELTYGEAASDYSVCNVKAVAKISRVILYVWPARMAEGEVKPYLSATPVRVAVDVMENILSLDFAESREAEQVARSDGRVLTVAGNHYEISDGKLTVVPDGSYTVDIRAGKASSGEGGGVVNTDNTVDIRNLVFGNIAVRRTAVDEKTGEEVALTEYKTAEELDREGLTLSFANATDAETGRVKQQLVVEMRNLWKPAEVTIPVEWAGNESFGKKIRATVTLNLVKNAVRVTTSEQLFDATENRPGYAVVLGADIMLGTDPAGGALSVEARRALLKTMYSTYNTEFYRSLGRPQDATVQYVLEFKQSVYGNGYTVNAEYFTNAKDGTGNSIFFKGPLDFVRYADTASVAAQDNIAFLCRTDGITLYNTVLLGCNDSSLEEADGSYNLTKLNNTGTTLEINADVEVRNCRIRNGRNVVRVYGGNRDASAQFGSYFIGSLDRYESAESERINVKIDGCVLAFAREFIVKAGSNLALHSGAVLGAEPALTDENGEAYDPDPQAYLDDAYFYNKYVVTDLTLKDSVLDTSGLFSVGVESNFAGPLLSAELELDFGDQFPGADAWPGTGGTSFAAVVRLEGDVRLYDWKDISRIDSSTLIQVNSTAGFVGDWLRLNLASMLQFVREEKPEYGDIIDAENHVHGGIAVYGGGKNYAQIDLRGLAEARRDLRRYEIGIDVLAESDDPDLRRQGQYLPVAAGTQPFRFFMYDRTSENNYAAQSAGADKSVKPTLAF